MVAIIGKHSNEKHPDSNKIGYKNWQAFEIDKNEEKNNKLVVVELDSSCEALNECYGVGAKWINGFSLNKIKNALTELSR